MSGVATTFLWQGGVLTPRDDCDVVPASIDVADSWLVAEGSVLALDLHRSRFLRDVPPHVDAEEFWEAAIAAIPRTGHWFPRVELRTQSSRLQLLFRLRSAPERNRSVVLATYTGRDPRTAPRVKGPDLEDMVRLRTQVQSVGAQEAVILTSEGFVAEGSTTCLAWWRGDALAIPSDDIARIDSVTLRSVLALATALGVDILREDARLDDLDGCEVWALNALHGIRIVTSWVGGPSVAEEPGRLDAWRRRLDALRRPLPEAAP
ncbi:aminotransferase class IV [Pseudolysinimonas sp.]|jgi:branched-subunit amino acid aminotransferase/4-amino-4-deoxychorismate lyase|uniref:aminotransferase class IV n=1 Tax=Pseudolysinimonas sp. TaxID=2680009 RepID=UPI0037833A03